MEYKFDKEKFKESGYDAITVTHKSQQYSMVIQEYLKIKGVFYI